MVDVSLRNDGSTFVLEVRNDGAHRDSVAEAGVGLRLAALEALQHGGVLEYGESVSGAWQVRLVVTEQANEHRPRRRTRRARARATKSACA